MYFHLDLKIPDPRLDMQHPSNQNIVPVRMQFGMVEKIEKIFGKNLRILNPWFGAEVKTRRWKCVRFSASEIYSGGFPHCRRHESMVSPGMLHARNCTNSASESHAVLEGNAWLNRAFHVGNRSSEDYEFYDIVAYKSTSPSQIE